MKDWNCYSANTIGYPSKSDYRDQLIAEINNRPLTAAARTAALATVPERVRDWFNEAILPYRQEQARLNSEFWADCRADLGYDKFLDVKGISRLEAHAWEDGHSAGYSEVYGELSKLVSLIEDIKGHIRKV
jgi:hypothetical protein